MEREIGHVLARVLIQHQNGTDWIALEPISLQKAAVCTNAKVGHKNSRSQQFIQLLKLSCHGLFLLIISEWQLEPVVAMAAMQRDVWRGKQETFSHLP